MIIPTAYQTECLRRLSCATCNARNFTGAFASAFENSGNLSRRAVDSGDFGNDGNSLHSCPIDSIEQHLKRPFRLRAMLGTKAKHHDLALPSGKADGRRLAFQALRTVSVA